VSTFQPPLFHHLLSPNSVLSPAMNILPLRLLLIDIANANDSNNRKAFTGVSMFLGSTCGGVLGVPLSVARLRSFETGVEMMGRDGADGPSLVFGCGSMSWRAFASSPASSFSRSRRRRRSSGIRQTILEVASLREWGLEKIAGS